MTRIGQQLNLKKHTVGRNETKVEICSPVDIEGHKGLDGRYYLLDFARYMPPEPPSSEVKGSILFRLLRPELVRRFGKPLSPDAFSKFGVDQSQIHNGTSLHYFFHIFSAEVVDCFMFLMEKVVPEFCQTVSESNIDELLRELHLNGISYR
jgi:hypothetical protein